ncbi:MAG: alpha/beta hydrolase family protein [Byssovorax sp.]
MASGVRAAHWLDHVAAWAAGRKRLFKEGWGDEALLGRLGPATRFEEAPARVAVTWSKVRAEGRMDAEDGRFTSPVAELPPASREVVVRRLLPRGAASSARRPPIYVVLGASGEEGFGMRTRLYRPLVEAGQLGVVLVENALYGARRPAGQKSAWIRTVGEQLLMNLAMVEEARALLDALEAEGYDRRGITGFSMGGAMAALVAAVTPRPIAAAIFAAGGSGVPVFNDGLLATGIDFDALGRGHGGVAGARARIAEIFGAADLVVHPRPRRPDAAVIVAAQRDGYVFAEHAEALHAHWAGSELRWADTGHAGLLLFHAGLLRQAALDAMSRLGGP